ncbi:NAD-dependent epimerase/dehydratase family protein [Psychrobacillus sp. FSL W7-1457]|uniref:NAD-dependent epimerase/dehydratase family protein n=1 Tax=Psychrobacillus sp. FSL W7-1457 TaxID=2954547 RepID=UPI003159B316
MRVLITGGYGFIGSHVADRYFKEGYDVFILDDLSTGNKEHIKFKHKSYIVSVEDKKCEEIFRSYHFDVVIHLAAQVSVMKSILDPKRDTEINAVGLVNILSLSHKYKVGKFIFASSAAVYGANEQLPLQETNRCNPISPYGMSKWLGESYCEKWRELYGYESVVFRFSNVYGPRQGNTGEGGVVSTFLERITEGKHLEIYGDGEQTRDFIYVGDVADAIYRTSNSNLSGIYNLSTNSEISINELVGLMEELHGETEVAYTAAKEGDIQRSSLSNEKLVNDLDWSPMFSMKRGLEQTYEWMKDKKAKQTSEKTVTSSKKAPSLFKQFQPYIENVLVFSVIAWLTLANQVSVLNIVDFALFYILIIGVIYGNRQSIIAVCLSIGLLIFEKTLEGRELISLTYDTSFLLQVALFLSIGLIVGYSIERKNNLLKEQKSKLEEHEDRYSFLSDMHAEMREVKKELQLRVLNTGDGLGKIHYLLKELDTLDPERIYLNSIDVLQKMMKVKKVSIYKFSNDNASYKLVADSGSFKSSATLKVEDDYVQQIANKKSIFVNKTLLPNAPLMAACLSNSEEKIALITIDDLEFEHISLYHENLFKIITELIEAALVRALHFQSLSEQEHFLAQSPVLKESVFQKILQTKREAYTKFQIPYLLLEGMTNEETFIHDATEISKEIDETDYIGESNEHHLLVLLANTSKQAGEQLVSRLSEKGIVLKLVEGEL